MENRTYGAAIVGRIDLSLLPKNLKRQEMCRILDIPQNTLSSWKTRDSDPPVNTIFAIADYLGVSVRWLVTGEEDGDGGLTADERWVLETWRGLSPDQRGTVRAMLEGLERKKSGGEEKIV